MKSLTHNQNLAPRTESEIGDSIVIVTRSLTGSTPSNGRGVARLTQKSEQSKASDSFQSLLKPPSALVTTIQTLVTSSGDND